jgi:hypothetical protein
MGIRECFLTLTEWLQQNCSPHIIIENSHSSTLEVTEQETKGLKYDHDCVGDSGLMANLDYIFI